MRTKMVLAALVVAFGVGAVPAADPLPRGDVDKKVRKVAFDAATTGSDMFNGGNQEGCLRLYEGTLMAVLPFLDHRPELAKMVRGKLDAAKVPRPGSATGRSCCGKCSTR